MHSPLRSESDVFRLVIAIVIGVALVVVVTLLTQPVVGVILAAALVGFGIGLVYRGARGGLPRQVGVTGNEDATHRLLVIANRTVTGQPLLEEIRERAGGRDGEILLVTPAMVTSRAAHWSSDLDQGIELARERMDRSLATLAAAGLHARGEVGDCDPNMAIEDALRHFAADEIVISTLPSAQSRWLERGVVARTRAEVAVPVTHVVVDLEEDAQPAGTKKRASVSSPTA